MTTAKRFGAGILIGFLLATLFSAPWVYRAWAVGSCAVFRTWNTGDSVTAGDLNSSFTTAAVTNSTPQCLDDYSATVAQMQTTTDPYASGTESLATSTAGEIERLRFMFRQIFGLTQWYRHDQAPTFSFSHMNAQALHLGSTGVAGGTDTVQNQFLSRFPVLTGPDHWTGIWWPHNTAHMAFSFRDYNHAQGGVQGGIELFRFHARGLIFHHTVSLMFRHSLAGNGATTHVTALSIDPLTDQLLLGHPGATMRFQGTGLTGQGSHQKALFLSSAGHVYADTVFNGNGVGTATVHRVVLLRTDNTTSASHMSARISFADAGSALTAGNTIFMGTWATAATELVFVQQIIPFKATITNLYVKSSAAPGAGQTYTFTLMKNGIAQNLAVILDGAAQTTGSNTSFGIDIDSGDYISLRAIASAGATANPALAGSVAIVPRP